MLIDQVLSRIALLLVMALMGSGCSPPRAQRVVLIVIDTLRQDHLSCYGGSIPTPHMDALAARGTLFKNAYSSFHQTTMSMGSLFTGRTPSLDTTGPPLTVNGRTWCGLARFRSAADDDTCIPRDVPTLAESIRSAGYWTIGIQSNVLLFEPAGYARGFDDWVEVGLSPGAKSKKWFGLFFSSEHHTGPKVIQATREALQRRPNDHFFLYVHLMDAHDAAMRKRSYADGVAAADAAVGALMKELDDQDLLDDTVVILTSDHGEGLGEDRVLGTLVNHGGNPSYEPLLRVPLLVAPALDESGDRFIRGDDVHRLIQRIAMPGFVAESADLQEGELYVSEIFFRTYRKGSWKSFHVRKPHTDQKLLIAVPPPAGTPDVILIDLAADPDEQINVAGSHPEIVRAHRARVREIGEALAVPGATPMKLSEEDNIRLRALGYLE